MENVKNLVGKKYRDTFDKILKDLEDMGYTNYWKVLNTKDYGIPQNRERVYVVSILGEHEPFEFPDPFYNWFRLEDLLEDEVDEKYYISDEKCRALLGSLKDGFTVKEATKKGYAIANEYDSINIQRPTSDTRRGRVGRGVARTLETSCNQAVVIPNECKCVGRIDVNGHDYLKRVYDPDGISPTVPTVAGGGHEPKVINNYRIRKLTPKECWRLQAFPDRDFEKARTRLMEQFYKGKDKANSQLYKQAGNSITVDVLRYIFGSLLK